MSVLIKDMEMPTSCTECPCCRHDNWNGETAHQCNVSFITFGAEDENWIYNTRPNWCPLIEIPTSHGRLIDAESVYEICGEKQGRASSIGEMQGISKVWKAVKRLPTVIEAEGSEE